MNPKEKVMIGSGGGGIGIAFAVIFAWLLQTYQISMPPEVQTAIGAVLVWVFERLGGYFNRRA